MQLRQEDQPDINADISSEDHFLKALLYGLLASIAGAIIWAFIAYIVQLQIRFMAIGVGALVGFTIRYIGKGKLLTYSVMGALITLFGCLLGSYLSEIAVVSNEFHLYFIHSYNRIFFRDIPGALFGKLHITDLVFYTVAVFEGFRFSTLKERSLQKYPGKNGNSSEASKIDEA